MKARIKNIIYKLALLVHNKITKPKEVAIEVTNKCNLDCQFCFNKFFKNDDGEKQELDYRCIKDIIDNICKFGIRRVRFSGGEPLLREDIYDILEYAKSKGLQVWLNTNATLIDEKNISKLSKLVDSVLIPLNSFDSTTESLITKNFLFECKISGIKLLKKANIKIIRIGTVATKFNIQNLERIHNIIEKFKVNYWLLFRPIPNPSNLFPIDNQDIQVLVEKIIKINKESNSGYKIYNAIPFCAYEPVKVSQVAVGARYDDGHTRLIIDSRGIVRPMYYMGENIGDVLINRDIKRHWNNKFMRNIRNLKFIPPICNRCKYLSICLGGSRAVSNIVNKSLTQLDYLAQPLKYKKQLFNG